jgi:hypothetical protein
VVRGWVVALVVVTDVLSLVLLLTTTLASSFSDRLPSNVVVGHSAGSFPEGTSRAEGLGLVDGGLLRLPPKAPLADVEDLRTKELRGPCSWTSENSVKAKVRELPFHALGSIKVGRDQKLRQAMV